MGYPTKLGNQTRDRVLAFVRMRASGVSIKAIIEHMQQRYGTPESLAYHVQVMVTQGTLTKHGTKATGILYGVASGAQTLDETRAAIAALPPRVFDAGPAPSPYRESLTPTEDPVSISWLGRAHGNSIIDRIKKFEEHFTFHDVRFLENLVKTRFPLSEQQEITRTKEVQESERKGATTPRASTNGHSNGVLAGNRN